jgi:hypothetical protein
MTKRKEKEEERVFIDSQVSKIEALFLGLKTTTYPQKATHHIGQKNKYLTKKTIMINAPVESIDKRFAKRNKLMSRTPQDLCELSQYQEDDEVKIIETDNPSLYVLSPEHLFSDKFICSISDSTALVDRYYLSENTGVDEYLNIAGYIEKKIEESEGSKKINHKKKLR